jgi:hypothetical protein
MSAQSIAAFPDTNLFLHYRPVNEIDWCSVLHSTSVNLKIAPVVTRELEEQKTINQVRKLKERATGALKLLYKHIGVKRVRDGVTLEFLIKEPTVEYAASHALNLQLGDDWLIGAFLLYREDHPETRCVLATNDLPLTIKANHYQIECVSLDQSLQLPSEPDPLEKKARQLEAELLRYKSREPDLSLRFVDGGQHARFRFESPIDTRDPEPEIQETLAAARQKCPLVGPRLSQPVDPNSPFAAMLGEMQKTASALEAMARQFSEHYNRRVRKYYADYERYLRNNAMVKVLDTRAIVIQLELVNGGTCPAEDIQVLLHLPDGFTLYDEAHLPKPLDEPTVPSKEANWYPSISALSGFPEINRFPTMRNPSLPKIRKTNSYDVTFEFPKLQHGFSRHLEPLHVAFESWDSVSSFGIEYTIHAGNMIDNQTGQLGVVVEKG